MRLHSYALMQAVAEAVKRVNQAMEAWLLNTVKVVGV